MVKARRWGKADIFLVTVLERCEMMETTIELVDGELGFVMPEEVVKRLNLQEGDIMYVLPYPGAVLLTLKFPSSSAVERAFADLAVRYDETLRQLANEDDARG